MNLDTLGATGPQRQAIETLDRPLLLCAGAGSGKTFTLQQRIAYALSPESGPAVEGVDRVLVITFTRKAAGEIKSRVRSVLRENGMAEEALKVDDAWISTIHGMALRILREHGLELGLPPRLAQLEEDRAAELRQRAFDVVLRESEGQPESPLAQLIAALGATGKGSDARALTFALMKHGDTLTAGLDAFDFGPAAAPPSGIMRQAAAGLEEFLAGGGSPKQMEKAEEALRQVRELLESSGSLTYRQAAAALAGLGLPSAQGKAKEAVRALKTSLAGLVMECVLGCNEAVAESLMAVARRVQEEYGALKQEADCVDTADILRLAYRALSDRPLLRQQLQQRFQLIMVDEFQDTNQLQIDLIGLLCRPGLTNLCTVGDSQQSIYRFQGADVNVYLKHKRQMTGEAKARSLQLDANFRSHGDILAFVRRICGAPGFFSEDFLDLQAGRNEEKAAASGAYRALAPRISVALTSYGSKQRGETAKTAFAKQQEARHIAQWFARLRMAGHDAGDMVLLLGSTTHLDVYADALQQEGFSCHMEGGSGFYGTAESKLAASLLRALVCPLNTRDLFEALSGPMFQLSADDFMTLSTVVKASGEQCAEVRRRSIGRPLVVGDGDGAETEETDGEVLQPLLPAPGAALGRVLEIWRRAQATVRRDGPACALRQLARESGYFSRLQEEGVTGQAKAANFLKAITVVEGLQAQPGAGTAQVAQRYQALAAGNEKLGSLQGDGGQSVRIMTVHGSKGLEFPFVVVADCYTLRPESGALLCAVRDGRAAASLASSLGDNGLKAAFEKARTTVKDDEEGAPGLPPLARHHQGIREESAQEGLLEKRRLFYVAATRASEAMLVSLCVNNTKEGLAPKGVQADVLGALFGEEVPRQDGTADYGGSQPLEFAFIDADRLWNEQSEEEREETAGAAEGRVVEYPPLSPDPAPAVVAGWGDGQGLVSYSSLTGCEGGALEGAQAVLEAYVEELDGPIADGLQEAPAVQPEGGAPAPVSPTADFGDGAGEERGESFSDRDKATDFGGALHRLCQLDALTGEKGAWGRFEAVADAYGVRQRQRLQEAFARWLASDVRREAREWEWVQPELSFQAQLGANTLQGEIDLFCANGPAGEGGRAFVVDYKTGGQPQETARQLYWKHRLQALCYAYAVLRQGFSEVSFVFVRVEQEDAACPGQPQVVRYRFRRRAT